MKSTLSFILLILLSSCHPLFCTWNSGYNQLEKSPPKDKIIGLYRLTEKSQKYLNGNTEWALEVELHNDNKYVFKNKLNPTNTKSGKWLVICDKKNCVMELEGICVEPFNEKKGKLAIQITIGDGDECEGIIYEKIK